MKRTQLLGFDLSLGTYQEFIDNILRMSKFRESAYVCVANVHMFVEARQDPSFRNIVGGAEIVTPDGKPLTWALRLLSGVRQDRVAGCDLLPDLVQACEKNTTSVYFYGGTPQLLSRTENFLRKKYPNLQIAGLYSPPFRELTEKETDETAIMINDSNAEIVFVVLGCPKQEKWMASMKGRVNSLMVGVGGAVPFMIGDQKRAPVWMQHAGLEWLYRLAIEPGRLFKRYAITNPVFIYALTIAYFRTRVLRKPL